MRNTVIGNFTTRRRNRMAARDLHLGWERENRGRQSSSPCFSETQDALKLAVDDLAGGLRRLTGNVERLNKDGQETVGAIVVDSPLKVSSSVPAMSH